MAHLDQIIDAGHQVVFTDRHAYARLASFYNSPEQLAELDWNTIRSDDWRSTEDDQERKGRKQAEYLVYKRMPWELINGIGTMSDDAAHKVETALKDATHRPRVKRMSEWYY